MTVSDAAALANELHAFCAAAPHDYPGHNIELFERVESFLRTLIPVAVSREEVARIEHLEKENFALAANQCHAGYGDEWGNHRCEKIDALKDALLGLIEALELDGERYPLGPYTAMRLSDAQNALFRPLQLHDRAAGVEK